MSGVPTLPDGLGEPVDSRPLHGGSIARTWWARLSDDREVVVKATTYDAGAEADGLRALADAGAPVPTVIAVAAGLLVLEFVHGEPDWGGLGSILAEVHRRGSGETFGWHRDNVLGPLPQRNPATTDWPELYVEHRLRPHLDAPDLPATVRDRIERACDGPARELLGGHDPVPCLVHGDLWSGNVVDGAWLIDPAVYRADREVELAFADVFGGFPRAFWDAYEATWPLPSGWRERRPALQLYHLLVHVRLFGAGYVNAVISRLDALGW